MCPRFDHDDLARRRAASSVVDSWANYAATGNLNGLKEEIESNPDADIARQFLHFAFTERDLRALKLFEQCGVSFREVDDPFGWGSVLYDAILSGRDCPEVIR